MLLTLISQELGCGQSKTRRDNALNAGTEEIPIKHSSRSETNTAGKLAKRLNPSVKMNLEPFVKSGLPLPLSMHFQSEKTGLASVTYIRDTSRLHPCKALSVGLSLKVA